MAKHKNAVDFTSLLNEKIVKIKYGDELNQFKSRYQSRTIECESGKVFVITSSMNEPTIYEVITTKDL